MPGPLPTVCRFENDIGGARMAFSCMCGEAVNAYAAVDTSTAEVRCPRCGVYVQVRASREYAAEGGKPGSGKP